MRGILVSGLVLAAASGAASANECDAMVAKLVGKHHLTVERKTEVGNVLMRHALARNVTYSCGHDGLLPDIYINTDTAYPSAEFLSLASRLGSDTASAPAGSIRTAIVTCQQQALRSQNESGRVRGVGFFVECQAFTRDGGGTSLTIGKPDKDE